MNNKIVEILSDSMFQDIIQDNQNVLNDVNFDVSCQMVRGAKIETFIERPLIQPDVPFIILNVGTNDFKQSTNTQIWEAYEGFCKKYSDKSIFIVKPLPRWDEFQQRMEDFRSDFESNAEISLPENAMAVSLGDVFTRDDFRDNLHLKRTDKIRNKILEGLLPIIGQARKLNLAKINAAPPVSLDWDDNDFKKFDPELNVSKRRYEPKRPKKTEYKNVISPKKKKVQEERQKNVKIPDHLRDEYNFCIVLKNEGNRKFTFYYPDIKQSANLYGINCNYPKLIRSEFRFVSFYTVNRVKIGAPVAKNSTNVHKTPDHFMDYEKFFKTVHYGQVSINDDSKVPYFEAFMNILARHTLYRPDYVIMKNPKTV